MPRPITPKVRDQTSPPRPTKKHAATARRTIGTSVRSHTEESTGSMPPETVNYITGCRGLPLPVREQPELMVEGGIGSLMIDLRGMGVKLHQEAFAFRMPDDSLAEESIRCGDIAVVEPCKRELQEGDIVMVALDGVGTLRRVTYRGQIAYYQGHNGEESPLLPAWEHTFSGVVTAVFRVFYHGRLLPRSRPITTAKSKSLSGRRPRRQKRKLQPPASSNRLRDDAPEPGDLEWHTP